MKIIQLNAWLGHLMHPMIDFLEQEQPDILCAQEILSSELSNPIFDNIQIHEKLSEIFPYQFFAPASSFSVLDNEVTLGNAIYSKFPIQDPQTIFINGVYEPHQSGSHFVRNIRNLQICSVLLGDGKTIQVANHHGFHDLDPQGTPETVELMKKVAQGLKNIRAPLVFCGDLNIEPSSPGLEQLNELGLRNLTAESTLHTTLSSLTRVKRPVVCDYIFVSDEVQVQKIAASEKLISDHVALILEFEV